MRMAPMRPRAALATPIRVALLGAHPSERPVRRSWDSRASVRDPIGRHLALKPLGLGPVTSWKVSGPL